MNQSRRDFMRTTGAAAASLAMPNVALSGESQKKKPHIVTLSFDDGFKKSFIRTSEIFEKYKLSACLNVIATGHKTETSGMTATRNDAKPGTSVYKPAHQ